MTSRGPLPSPEDGGFVAWMNSPAAGDAVTMLNKLARLEIVVGGKRSVVQYSGENALIDLKAVGGLSEIAPYTVLANSTALAAIPVATASPILTSVIFGPSGASISGTGANGAVSLQAGASGARHLSNRGFDIVRGLDKNFSAIIARPEVAQNGANVITEFSENNDRGNTGYAFFGIGNGDTWATGFRTAFISGSWNGSGTPLPFTIWSRQTFGTTNWALHVPANTSRVIVGGGTIADDGVNALQVVGSMVASTSIKTGNPSGGTAAAWKLGSLVTAAVTPDTTRYLQLDVGGTLFKVIIST